MANMFVVDEGELEMLKVLRTHANTNYRVGLYKNTLGALAANSVWSDITPATFTGSSEQTPVYAAPTLAAGTQSMAAAPLTFTLSSGGPETVTGYYIRDNAAGKLVKVQDFAAGQLMSSVGDAIVITDTLLLKGSITS